MDQLKIDATNVWSVLQRAERDKAEAAIDDCVRFLVANLQVTVHASASASGIISDDVVCRIARRCHHDEVELLRDKCDRIRSRLFRHLTERLLEPDAKPELGCAESAANVFLCAACSRLLHPRTASTVKCRSGHFRVDDHGELKPKHTKNEEWNVRCYVKSLFARLKCWRHVYWKLWSDVHYLDCVKCSSSFPCSDISGCEYHPCAAQFSAEPRGGGGGGGCGRNTTAAIGHFPCCKRPACRFDPWELNDKGCRQRDHVVNPSSATSLNVHREFVCHRDAIRESNRDFSTATTSSATSGSVHETRVTRSGSTVEGATSELAKMDRPRPAEDKLVEPALPVSTDLHSSGGGSSDKPLPTVRPRARSDIRELSDGHIRCGGLRTSTSSSEYESEGHCNSSTSGDDDDDYSDQDDVDDDGSSSESSMDSSSAVIIDDPSQRSSAAVAWDATKSRRRNHDVLRESEQRRFRELIDELLLTSTSTSTSSTREAHYAEKQQQQLQSLSLQRRDQGGHPAGIYGRLEGEWRAARAAEAASSFRSKATSVLATAKFKLARKN